MEDKLFEEHDQLESEPQAVKVFGRHDFVFLSDCAKCRIVPSLDIVTIEADGNFSKVDLANGGSAIMIRRPLHKCESKLDPSIFFRTGRSCIVNLNHVKEVQIFDRKRYVFIMTNGKDIILSGQRSICLRRQKSL